MRTRTGLLVAACAAMILTAFVTSASAQRSGVGVFQRAPQGMQEYQVPPLLPEPPQITPDNYCAWAPAAYSCGDEVVMTTCMTPEEWADCPDRRWFASSYDQKDTAPAGAWQNNGIRFYERCGAISRKMGSPRMAYWYAPRRLSNGMWHPGRWIVFAYSPSRR